MIFLSHFRPVACYSWRFGVGDFAQVQFNTSVPGLIEISFLFWVLTTPRLIGLKEIHLKSTQRNLGKRRPSQWWGEVNCQKISWNINMKNLPKPGKNRNWPKSSSHTAWKIWITRAKCFHIQDNHHIQQWRLHWSSLFLPWSEWEVENCVGSWQTWHLSILEHRWWRWWQIRALVPNRPVFCQFWRHWWWRWWQIWAMVPDRADQSPEIK